MVLESLIDPRSAEDKPYKLFIIGALYTFIAFIIGFSVFGSEASLISVFLIVFAAVPLFFNTVKFEEAKDENSIDETKLLKEHFKAFRFFMYFFIGIVIAYAMAYVFLPQEFLIKLFSVQMNTIEGINGKVIANEFQIKLFGDILFNNIKVLALCVFFAFVYGTGAIFILVWNASVVGVAMGSVIRHLLSIFGGPFGYFQAISLGILRYSIHGIPEILAYFVAGLAGSIISYATIKYGFRTKKYSKVIYDSSILLIISIALLFLAAILEVFVTGNLFY